MKTAELRNEVRTTFRSYRKNEVDSKRWWDFINERRSEFGEEFNCVLRKVLDDHDTARRRLKKYLESALFRFKIRKYCNLHLFSDIEPCEVVEIISKRKVKIRKMDAVIKTAPKDFHAGGFSGNFSDNDQQRWECVSNSENEIEVITLTKNGWGCGRYKMSDQPRKFYDYNF